MEKYGLTARCRGSSAGNEAEVKQIRPLSCRCLRADMGRTAKRTLHTILSLLIVLTLFVSGYELHLRHNVIQLSTDVLQLSESENPNAAFNELRKTYGIRMRRLEHCTTDDCAYEVKFTNEMLSFLRLAPRVEFSATFNTLYDKLWFVLVDYITVRDPPTGPFVHTQITFCEIHCKSYINPWQLRIEKDLQNGNISVDSSAPLSLKKASLAYDPLCMTRLAGCKDISQMLPPVWERTSESEFKCRIINDRGAIILSTE